MRRACGGLALLVALPFAAQFHYLVPDSAGYVAYARSLLWDRDLDFTNDYARLGTIEREGGILFGARTAAGRPGNPFGLGAALLWLPWVLLSAALAHVAAAAGSSVATNGFGTLTLCAAHLGSWTCALAAWLLVRGALVEAFPDTPRAARRPALAGAFLGTPLLYYVLQMASYSHAASAFCVALLAYLALRWRQRWDARRAAWLGAVLGLAGLVRAQDLAFGVLPLGVGWWGGALRRRGDIRLVLVFGAAAALVFAPQLAAWRAIYGGFRVPQGPGFLHLSAAKLFWVLAATRHGLFSWSPVVLLAAAGWLLLVRSASTRGLGLSVLAAFAAQWLLDSLPVDWWAGWSFGARRFVACLPLVALGLAALVRAVPRCRWIVYALVAANLVQLARVASRQLSGESDPGWSQLWGSGFAGFVPHLPAALWGVLRTPWTALQILRRPEAVAPSLHADPAWALLVFCLLWAATLLGVWVGWGRRMAGRARSAAVTSCRGGA